MHQQAIFENGARGKIEKMSKQGPVYTACHFIKVPNHLKKLSSKYHCVYQLHFYSKTTAEMVVQFSKGEIDSKNVRVEFSLEYIDMSGFQKGATYDQIKAYVMEHTGLKVSSLYISQVKRKCGLDVGQNYNLPKSEGGRVLQCPPEKEQAIMEALKPFQII